MLLIYVSKCFNLDGLKENTNSPFTLKFCSITIDSILKNSLWLVCFPHAKRFTTFQEGMERAPFYSLAG